MSITNFQKSSSIFMGDPSEVKHLHLVSDAYLFRLCKMYGERARLWKQKFAGLLSEVNKRKLYERKGFTSIFEFAKKLAGMTEEHVRTVLNLEKRFVETPILHSLLVNGEVSANKLVRVASIATAKNQEFLAMQVQLLTNRAVETLVRDEKMLQNRTANHEIQKFNNEMDENKNPNDLQESLFENKSMHVQVCTNGSGQVLNSVTEEAIKQSNFGFSEEVREKLLELKNKGIDIDKKLLEFLEMREEKIIHELEEISMEVRREKEEQERCAIKGLDDTTQVSEKKKKCSRHIQERIKKLLKDIYGTKCSIETCNRPSKEIHHIQRFLLSQNHNPLFLAPLCKEHHEIAQTIDLEFHHMKKLALSR